MKQSIVQVWAKQRVMQRPVIAGDCVFVWPETVQVVGDKVAQLGERAGARGGPGVGWGHAELGGNLLVDFVALVL
ncbi:unannotated protein [freshwater metagenome]|uniref:Unannotated protein n=1 Tax=freshwater metagenome TaxID=449393 RepID=A0A6J6J156_9ZZZZ